MRRLQNVVPDLGPAPHGEFIAGLDDNILPAVDGGPGACWLVADLTGLRLQELPRQGPWAVLHHSLLPLVLHPLGHLHRAHPHHPLGATSGSPWRWG